jgi:hypothetical protein
MHQHDIRPTTEDIAATDEPRDEADRTTEMGRAEMGRARTDRDEFGRTDTNRADIDRDDIDRADIDRDETSRDEFGRDDVERGEFGRDPMTDADRDDVSRIGGATTDRDRHETTGEYDTGGITEVDETARPTDTTLAGANQPGRRENVADVLFDEAEATRFQERWREVQSQFVDDPKQAVQDADVLVAELMQTLASAFSERKRLLEQQWREGSDTETEDLRLTLRGYRSFLDQLLTH